MPPLTYSSYLQLDALLSAQKPRSEGPEHDEMLFIIIHQVYELWFKEVLHEIDFLKKLLIEKDTPRALHTLRRILTILKTLVAQIDILETMTPLDFLSFRDRLESASGFESYQFRELEFVLGHKQQSLLIHHPEGSHGRANLEKRFHEPTLWDAFLIYLDRSGYDLPDTVLDRDLTEPLQPSKAVQETLILVYKTDPVNVRICERLVDMDEGFQEWRYRHVKMVERTIGSKPGTGGSAGVSYLKTTLLKPFFPDLWSIRTEI